MNDAHSTRKLTTIMAADVVGYSKLMGWDEEATLATLKKYRAVFFGLVERHGGRICDAVGDAILAEFISTVEAVYCAIAVQDTIRNYNEDPKQAPKMQFRIGINVGDVIAEEGAIFGDGVNIAARMESLAPAGGICVSGGVYEIVHNKISLSFVPMGPKKVKNINKPIATYSLALDSSTQKAEWDDQREQTKASGTRKVTTFQAGSVLLIVAVMVLLFLLRSTMLEQQFDSVLSVGEQSHSQGAREDPGPVLAPTPADRAVETLGRAAELASPVVRDLLAAIGNADPEDSVSILKDALDKRPFPSELTFDDFVAIYRQMDNKIKALKLLRPYLDLPFETSQLLELIDATEDNLRLAVLSFLAKRDGLPEDLSRTDVQVIQTRFDSSAHPRVLRLIAP